MESPVYRLFVERKKGFENEARRTQTELVNFVGIRNLEGVRFFNRYDIEGIDEETLERAATQIFSEPQGDEVSRETIKTAEDETAIAIEYLPGQYDQRADSAEQCLALLWSASSLSVPDKLGTTENIRSNVTVRCARLFVLKGKLTADELAKIRAYLINPVDSRETTSAKPESLLMKTGAPAEVPVLDGFIGLDPESLATFHKKASLAMDLADIAFLQSYFKKIGRNPTETEIRVLDTYWSDHCRHTTFNTVLDDIAIADGPYAETFRAALASYSGLRAEIYAGRGETKADGTCEKPVTLMDMAVIGAKALKKRGLLADIEESAEINACSIFIDVVITDDAGKVTGKEPWLLMFKNETHNHPTEIEPFGGAATCIGGAIRDPLSGRAWVYQALRVTGAGDPTAPIEATLPGKLPQIKLTREAAAGFSAYGNQIGLTTGQVVEYYDPGFLAKRMELGAVIAATPVTSVVREEPEAGDIVIMVGGGTGRDGIGGATGSSKAHTKESVTTAGAEVQKGNAVVERKIQRLFRDQKVTALIRRCNDFGAGGVAVAVGELAAGLDIDLDAVPKKYDGLNGTELAISESQERMAVVVRERDAKEFIAAANRENLNAAIIAKVTDDARLKMRWRGKTIVDIERSFLDTAGAKRTAQARIAQPEGFFDYAGRDGSGDLAERWLSVMGNLAVASQRGLSERFDGSIGSSSVLFPMGGEWQSTPECGMAARIPVGVGKETTTTSLMTMGYDPKAANWSPYHGAQYAVLESLAKILALGGDPRTARLTFQEYFERTSSSEAWGKPAAALLGALEAQLAAGTAAIGGKDSMSGTFQNIHVPPTLVSFAVAVTEDKSVRGGAFTGTGNTIILVQTPWRADDTPDWDAFRANAESLVNLSASNKIRAAYPVTEGGIAAAITKMAFGNRIGAKIDSGALPLIKAPRILAAATHEDKLFMPLFGSILVEFAGSVPELSRLTEGLSVANWIVLGATVAEPAITVAQTTIPLDRAQMTWEKPLERVFPPVSGTIPTATFPSWATEIHTQKTATPKAHAANTSGKRPLVVLPVFPGTNCEYDMARAFRLAGADARILVLRNRTKEDLAESLAEFRKAIDSAQILAFSGGFSAGDEPDGSGKFIANVIRENEIADGIMELLDTRKGLVLGICNGFQALIKVGLVPYGKILAPSEEMPTLTYNTIGRHISRFARTRVTSSSSPWASDPSCLPGKMHLIPLSHGEGRVILREETAKELFDNGQIFTQYVDAAGRPAMTEPDNPNGSMYAIEGMTDASGRVLGKMGHSERPIDSSSAKQLFKNIPGDTCQNIFAAGVKYFD
jgi:phosphoribosylformylglycinamidine synthase